MRERGTEGRTNRKNLCNRSLEGLHGLFLDAVRFAALRKTDAPALVHRALVSERISAQLAISSQPSSRERKCTNARSLPRPRNQTPVRPGRHRADQSRRGRGVYMHTHASHRTSALLRALQMMSRSPSASGLRASGLLRGMSTRRADSGWRRARAHTPAGGSRGACGPLVV